MQSQRQTMSTLVNPRSEVDVNEKNKRSSPMTSKQVTFRKKPKLEQKTEPHSRTSPIQSVKSGKLTNLMAKESDKKIL